MTNSQTTSAQHAHHKTTRVLATASILTTVTVIAFVAVLSAYRSDSPTLSDIGGVVGGFASLLAFIWLIVTVLLQYSELQLQRQELAELRAASQDQADSLRTSTKVQSIMLLRQRCLDRDADITSRVETNESLLINILSNRMPQSEAMDHVYRHFDVALWSAIVAFVDPAFRTKPFSESAISSGALRRDFDYSAYANLVAVRAGMHEIAIMLRPIYQFADVAGAMDEFNAWATHWRVNKYDAVTSALDRLLEAAREIVAEGHVGDPIDHILAQAYSPANDPPD